MTSVFLGGTCNGSTWRDELVGQLDLSLVDPFNPVVEDWNAEAQRQEIWHRENDDLCLYVLTPEMSGFYSVAEVVDDSNKRPEKTVFCVLDSYNGKEFDAHQKKSFLMTQKLVAGNGAHICANLSEVAAYLNTYDKQNLR